MIVHHNVDYILDNITSSDLITKIIKHYYYLINIDIINKQKKIKNMLLNNELKSYIIFNNFIQNLYNKNNSFYKLYTSTYLFLKMNKKKKKRKKYKNIIHNDRCIQ